MSLPLPNQRSVATHQNDYGFSAEQMQAYGQACRKAALEEVAKYAENFLKHGGSIAEEIRSFKS